MGRPCKFLFSNGKCYGGYFSTNFLHWGRCHISINEKAIEQIESNEYGKPKYFDVDLYLDAVESMICADEIKFAIAMLDNLPGYYRDNIPNRAKQIRSVLYGQCMTVQDYANDISENITDSEKHHNCKIEEQWKAPHFYPRGQVIVDLVKSLNDNGFCANIVELGPYNHWLPIGLESEKCDFIYTPISINKMQCPFVNKVKTEKPMKHIFICFEVIEHLWNEDEIIHYFYKSQMEPDFVLISTPKYTCGGGLPNWSTRQLGHVRTWTPTELTNYCRKHWPSLYWYFVDSGMMISVGTKDEVQIK